ncbi:MAG: magnesium/cobalt transporter CorA [Thermoplasmatota archaeon]
MADMDAVRSSGIGLPPGSLVYRGEKPAGPVKITLMDYDVSHVEEREIQRVEECFPFKDTPTITWVNVDGLHEVDIIEKIGRHFDIHPLALEDILHAGQRPKMEDFDDYLFIIFKMVYPDTREGHLKTEQVSLLLGPTGVISFQEEEGDVFEPIRQRIRNAKGRIRRMGADYLAYALVDAVVDNYFLTLEKIGEAVEDIEEELIADPSPETLQLIHRLKRELIYLRKSVWPLREVIGGLERAETDLIDQKTGIYLRDVYDHTIQVIDTVETFRDMVSGMLDIYLSSVSNRMNEVMKVLTIIATIFIPLTFIAGIYGMNFAHMPELDWRWSYPLVWLAMTAIAVAMLIYFHRKEWL